MRALGAGRHRRPGLAPEGVTTNLVNHAGKGMRARYATIKDPRSPDQPAETLVWLATDPEGARDPGGYFHN